jgi:hypothetical protein
MQVYVDGQLVTDVPQKYPDFSSLPLIRCHLGMCVRGVSHLPDKSSLYGGIGTFMVLSEHSTANSVKDLLEITPDYAPQFQKKE